MSKEKEPKGFDWAKAKAEKLIESNEQLQELISAGSEKATQKKEQMKDVWSDLQTLLSLVTAWWKKDYQEIPWKTILYAAAAIVYFVSPIDLVPDFIPIAGFLDDITVISFVVKSLKNDLDKFKLWQNDKSDEP